MTSIPNAPLSLTSLTSLTSVNGAQPGRGSQEKMLDAVAQKLGMSTDDLKQALASGKSMTEVAAGMGVNKDELVSTIAGALPPNAPGGQAADPTATATRIADRTRSAGHAHHGSGGSAASAASDGSALGQGIDALSQALGVSSSDLVQRLTDGSGIADLLSDNPDVSAQLSALQNRGAIVDGYA